MQKSKVYVTQIPERRDKTTGQFYPVVDISSAEEHGEIVIMMPAQARFYATNDLVKSLKGYLEDYDYEAGDSIVALGDPSIMAAAFALLGKLHGKFIVLKWDRNLGRYVPSHVSV